MDDAPLRIVIVDDEPLARAVVREYAAADPALEIVADCGNGFEAVKAVAELKPDLVLLDVQMPKLDGFEVLELLGREQAVVFITAYDQYALRAFEVHAVDYLLKPFSAERFQEAIERARERLRAKAAPPSADDIAGIVRDAKPKSGPVGRVLIRDGANVHVLPVDKIDYVEAQDDYVAFKSEGKQFLKDQTLSAVEGTLDPARFVRIHRSFILNIDRISKVELYAKDSRIGDPARRNAPAGEPRRLRAAVAVAVEPGHEKGRRGLDEAWRSGGGCGAAVGPPLAICLDSGGVFD